MSVFRLLLTTALLTSACEPATIADGGGAGGTGGTGGTASGPGPEANAGADSEVFVGELVSLDGRASTAGDGSIAYDWRLLSQPSGGIAQLTNETHAVASLAIDVAGEYVAELTVTQDDGKTDSDVVIVTALAVAALPPVAIAGHDRIVAVFSSLQLDGSLSFDPAGNALTFDWSLTSIPAGSIANLSGADTATPELTPDLEGDYLLVLEVSNGVATDTDALRIVATGTLPPNNPPQSRAGADQTVLVGTTVELDGSGSSDPDSDPLTLSWSFVLRPITSAATLSDPTASAPTFLADVAGTFTLELEVSDGQELATDTVTIVSTADSNNYPPVADAGPDLTAAVGSSALLDGQGSYDPEGLPLTYDWQILSQPSGGGASVTTPNGVSTALVPQLAGSYEIELTVSDGVHSDSDTAWVTAAESAYALGFDVVDAEYSAALNRIVLVGDGPPTLHLLDPFTKQVEEIGLGAAPLSVSVSPDGLMAAVGHNGSVTLVQLDPLAIDVTHTATADGADTVLAGNGWVYLFPSTGSWTDITCIELATGAETASTGSSISDFTRARLHPAGHKIYGADNGLSPSDIERYDIAGGTAAYAYDSPYHGDYGMCGDLWFSQSGDQIFTACGNVFNATDDADTDMTFAGSLPLPTTSPWGRIETLDQSLVAGLVAVVTEYDTWDEEGGDGVVLFDDQSFAHLTTLDLLPFTVGASSYDVIGRFAFLTPGAGFVHVIVDSADVPLPSPYGLVSFSLCDFGGACSGATCANDVDCDAPGPDACAGDTLLAYPSAGTCVGGGCYYTPAVTRCPYGCDDIGLVCAPCVADCAGRCGVSDGCGDVCPGPCNIDSSCATDDVSGLADSGVLFGPPVRHPIGLCDGRVIIDDETTNAISVVDLGTGDIAASFALTGAPSAVALDRVNNRLAVGLWPATLVASVDLATGGVDSAAVAGSIVGLAKADGAEFFAVLDPSAPGDPMLLIDGATLTVSDTLTGNSEAMIRYHSASATLFSADEDGTVRRFDYDAIGSAFTEVEASIDLGSNCRDLTVSSDGAHLAYACGSGNLTAGNIMHLDAQDFSFVYGAWDTGSWPTAVAFSHDGAYLAASNRDDLVLFDANSHVELDRATPTGLSCSFPDVIAIDFSIGDAVVYAGLECAFDAEGGVLWLKVP